MRCGGQTAGSTPSDGPTIETIVVHVFDVEKDRSHANYRECMGFYMVWEKGFGAARGLWGKSLTVYTCGNDGHLMSEDKLTRILASFSIEGEFEALVDCDEAAAGNRLAIPSKNPWSIS